MDDIADILAQVDRDAQDPFAAYDAQYAARGTIHYGQEDLQALTRAWVNERGSPELLPWADNDLIDRVNTLIKNQISKVEEMTGDLDPKTNFSLIIIQTEVERWKFLVRSYLRCRIAKIDKHALHYMTSPELKDRMSAMEMAYATRHQELLHSHYLGSFLGGFPPQLQNLNDEAGGISMIGGPDVQGAVFARGLGGGAGNDGSVLIRGHSRDADGDFEVARGEVVVARWSDVRDHVARGEMELV